MKRRKAILPLAILVSAALIVPAAAVGHERDREAVKVRIKLPVTALPPTPDCPASTIFTVDYRISWKGRTGSGRNCIVDFRPVDCAPAFCTDLPLLMMLRLPGGRIEVQGSLFERAPCDPASAPECTSVQHAWSGEVTDATGGFRKLEGGTLSGGGTAVYRFPSDPAEPFASADEVLVIRDADDEDDEDD